ncbi:MAG: nuclear transport factor 2 family protein [Pseudomonadota bacterium]
MGSQNHTQLATDEPDAVANLKGMYARFGRDMLELVPQVYADNIVFQDPVHRVDGLPALQTYLARTVENTTSCKFDFNAVHCHPEGSAWLEWTMHYAHPRLADGKLLTLEGATNVRFEQKIHYHRDYLDLGGMLYEHVPVIGGAVRWLKRRMAG